MSRRLALNHRRAAGRARRRDDAWPDGGVTLTASAEAEATQRDFQARLRLEIDRLPDKLRDALLLSAVEGLDTREAARILGIPEGTVRSRLHAARKELLRRFSA
jgi:RNA polymerase sigma-70 factor (ECF subfamily)